VKVERREEFMSWMAGWRDGAGARVKRDEFVLNKRKSLSVAYSAGYDAGFKARTDAGRFAMEKYNYVPSVLRGEIR
jgi:hypothetical protein